MNNKVLRSVGLLPGFHPGTVGHIGRDTKFSMNK